MKKTSLLASLAVVLAVSGCARHQKPVMTPLEIQGLQSRNYENSKEVVFPSVISVFQDLGYTITNANMQTGLISAESASNSNFAHQFWLGQTKVNQTKATAFIEKIGKQTRVRLNFVEISQTSSAYGQNNRHDTPILNAKMYESAFEKVDSAIFLRSAN